VVKDDTLTVTGKQPQQPEGEGRRFIHRGIAGRAFERRFALADHLVVQGARIENGLLHVALKREVPEALKPRRIPIEAAAQRQVLTQSAEAA
jgi:molecular chaperone IbpA